MKHLVLLTILAVLLTGCVHLGASVDYRTQTLQLMSESGPTFIQIEGNSQFQKHQYNRDHISDIYLTNSPYQTAIAIIPKAERFSAQGFFDGVRKESDTIIAKNNYTGTGMSPVLSMTLYDNCKLWRYAIFRFSQDELFMVSSQMDLQQSDFPCKDWAQASEYTPEQIVITRNFEKTTDQSLKVRFQ